MLSLKLVYWVLPGLLAGRPGPGDTPWDLQELWEVGFRTIVSLSSQADATAVKAAGFRHLHVRLNGGLAFFPLLRRRLVRQMVPVLDFIASEVAAGRPTLVHCRQGNDRSGAVLAGYLVRHRGLTPGQAVQCVRQANPSAMRSPWFERLVEAVRQSSKMADSEPPIRRNTSRGQQMNTAPGSDRQLVTIAEAVAEVVAQLDGPVPYGELIARVLVVRPSQARDPTAAIRNHLRQHEVGRSIVYLDPQTVVPMRLAMQGVRFRIPLSPREVKRNLLYLIPGFLCFLRNGLPYSQMSLLDQAGRPLSARVVVVKQKVQGLLGPFEYEKPALDLRGWFKAHRVQPDDSILVEIQDWESGCFRLEHEPARARRKHRQEIEQKNRELADAIYDILEHAADERVPVVEAVPTAYARISDPRGYPGDHWFTVVEQDPRMGTDGFVIRYAEFRTPIEAMIAQIYGEETALPEEPFSPQQARQVYRFKASLRYRPGLWRRIEIRGDQTLADFNFILVEAFEHDWDHMGGFWKRVRRGSSKRYREIDLGEVDPMGGGSGAARRIASLRLEPGDTLKYVFDFGDWIEHLITLEEVIEAEEGVKYPRIVGQNRPRYRYCVRCKVAGKRSIATWICAECSSREQREVLLCERCLTKEHEDHYAREILY